MAEAKGLKRKRHDADLDQRSNSNAIERGTTLDPSIGTYDVFISHRGLQMKRGFANHLYHNLEEKGIHAFLDMEELPQGLDVRPNMIQAARRATIGVPIFTTDYAKSSWCLKELAEMTKSGGVVIPVFYDVKSEELREEDGPFAKAIKTHQDEGKHDEEMIMQWESSLKTASWWGGFRLETYNQCEGELLKNLSTKIVDEVRKSVLVGALPDTVGSEKRVCDVVQLLRLENKEAVYFVLLWGMGGIGKTTLARDIYHRHRMEFDAASFVEKSEDEKSIQDCLRCDLLHDKNERVVRDDIAKGKAVLQRGLREKKVLIVLDDMKNFSSIEKAIDPTSLHPGSRILVTSRDQGVFPHINSFNNVFRGELYELLPLGVHESLRLLCLHAFNKPSPEPDFEEVAKTVVKACDGLPLSLEVLGRYLSRMKEKEQWQEAIKRLQSNTFKDIRGKLMISYEDLNEDEREMFLDVACFLIGERLSRAKYFWHGIHYTWNSGLQRLTELCLVKVDEKNHRYHYDGDDFDVKFLTMHDVLKDFGRSIVRDEFKQTGKWSRLWDDNDLSLVLQRKQGLHQIRGIATSLRLTADFLSRMQSLQLLFLNAADLDGDTKGLKLKIRWFKFTISNQEVRRLRQDVRRLRLDRFKELDTSFSPIKRIPKLASLEVCCLESLQVLDIEGTDIIKLPSFFGQLKRLRKLYMCRCEQLEKLTQEFGSLESLEELNIHNTSITGLPSSFGQLKRLRKLCMFWCSNLQKLPEEFGSLESLEELAINGAHITGLPSSFRQLKRLRKLCMSCSSNLEKLPEEFGCLESLEELNIGNTSITGLPASFGQLKRLRKLCMSRCSNLKKLPEEFGCLESLEELDINDTNITELPSSFGQLKRLRKLYMFRCKQLEKLPEEFGCLESLEELNINDTNITELRSSFGQLKRLRKLCMSCCSNLEKLPKEFGCLESLEELNIGNTSIIDFPESLEELDIKGTCITELPSSFGQLKRLRKLCMSCCTKLEKLPEEFGCLESLEELDITDTNITELPSSFGQLKRLRKLCMCWCSKLEKLPKEFGSLESLEELDIKGTCITELSSSFGQLKRLRKLYMFWCSKLEKLPEEFGCLESLEELDIKRISITGLPSSFGQLKRLRELCMSRCFKLEKLPEEFGCLESLEELDIKDTRITGLPSCFRQLKRLRNFIHDLKLSSSFGQLIRDI